MDEIEKQLAEATGDKVGAGVKNESDYDSDDPDRKLKKVDGRKKRRKCKIDDGEESDQPGYVFVKKLRSYLREQEQKGKYPFLFSSKNHNGIFSPFYEDGLCDYLKITCNYASFIPESLID